MECPGQGASQVEKSPCSNWVTQKTRKWRMTEDSKNVDKIQQAIMKFKVCRHNKGKAVITHVLVLLLFSSVYVFFH